MAPQLQGLLLPRLGLLAGSGQGLPIRAAQCVVLARLPGLQKTVPVATLGQLCQPGIAECLAGRAAGIAAQERLHAGRGQAVDALAQRGHFHPRKQRVAGRQGRGHLAAFGRLQGVTCGLVNAEGGLCAGQHGQRAEQQQDKGIFHACQNNHRW